MRKIVNFEIVLKPSTFNEATGEYEFLFNGEFKSIPFQTYRWSDEDLASAVKRFRMQDILSFTTL